MSRQAAPQQRHGSNLLQSAPRGTQEMMEMGQDIQGIDRARLATRRIRKGECPTCGTRLYKPSGGLLAKRRKTPLTIPGQVLDGRCLICCPLDNNEREAARIGPSGEFSLNHQPAIPLMLSIPCSDDQTVVSCITLENAFGSNCFDDVSSLEFECDGANVPPLLDRRGASAGGDDITSELRPTLPRRTHDYPNRKPPMRSHEEDEEYIQEPEHGRTNELEYFNSPTDTYHRSHVDDGDCHHEESAVHSTQESTYNPRTSGTSYDSSFAPSLHLARRRSENETVEEAHVELRYPRAAPVPQHSIDDVISTLRRLDKPSSSERMADILKLVDCIYELGGPGKETFCDGRGVEIVATILWTDMDKPVVAKAAITLLLALAASTGEAREVPVITYESAEGLMDALLITMQTLLRDAPLQEVCCQLLCCLSANGEPEIHDGTLSGAVQSVLNAMDAHPAEVGIQEWGVRALYNQCVHSRNAEPNKRSLASSQLDSGTRGCDVLSRILARWDADDPIVEWCCQLYWILSSSADVAAMITPPLKDMYRLLEELQDRPVQQEALLGALTNFCERDDDAAVFILKSMRSYNSHLNILHEASCLLGELVAKGSTISDEEEEAITDVVRILVDTLSKVRKDGSFVEDLLRALQALCMASNVAKAVMSNQLPPLLKLCRSQQNGYSWHELCCSIMASFFVLESVHSPVLHEMAFKYLGTLMMDYPDTERLQDVCCRVIRNLCCYRDLDSITILKYDFVKILTDAMRNFPDIAQIHANACCVFWNLKIRSKLDGILTGDDIQCIVTTLQNHLVDKEVVHMACGALWSNIYGSDELKQALFNTDGGVDAVACVLVMHPDSDFILEAACGVLLCLTVTMKMVESVVQTEGFHNLVDVTTNGRVSLPLLKCATMFMRNTCLAFPDFANEAADVVPVVVQAMKSNKEDAAFQREAISFLWLVAAQSGNVKSKILAMDGVALLMSIMECHNDGDSANEVKVAALGALHELANNN